MEKSISLNECTDIRFGLHATGMEEGHVTYLQARLFDDHGILRSTPDEFLNLDNKTESHLLQEGDILFVGKGTRLFAWCYRDSFGPAVASSIFFVLRPGKEVHPDYLTAVLNAPQSKDFFQQLGSGTNINSIRKSELGAFQFPVPPLARQKQIAALGSLHQQQVQLAYQLIAERETLYKAIISKIFK
jgi:restriction endonuclease S subunit